MNNKNFKVIMAVGVIALIAVVGVGFAAFSTNLKINGSGTVKASSWKIKFANLSTATLTGQAQEVTAPTLSNEDTHIGDYDVTFTSPGDSITYTFDVKNEGTFNAKVSSVVIPTPTCTGNGVNATTDASNVCKNLSYTLTYADGSPIAENDTLDSNETKNLKLTLTYSADTVASELPTDDVAISNLETTVVYSQN